MLASHKTCFSGNLSNPIRITFQKFARRSFMFLLRGSRLVFLLCLSIYLLGGCASSVNSLQGMVQVDWAKQNYANGHKTEAAEHYKRASEKGNAEAQFQLAKMLIFGDGIAKDAPQGIAWLEKASSQNYAPAMTMLGSYNYTGAEGLAQNGTRAVSLLEGSANQEDRSAMLLLGMVYTLNVGVASDPNKAAHWFERASQKGLPIPDEWMAPEYLAALYPQKKDKFDERRLASARTAGAQASLKLRGYDPGPVDGVPGKRTQRAIVTFQQKQGMNADGKIDSALMWHLLTCSDLN
jgi:TPR repeat protein